MSKTETNENAGIDRLAEALVDAGEVLSQKIALLADKYGEATVDLALAAARVDAASQLGRALAFAALMVLSLVVFRVLRKGQLEAKAKGGDESGWWFGMIPTAAATIAAAIATIVSTFNIWAWAGLFYPELWLAKRLLGL